MRASNLGEALREAGFDQFEHQARAVAFNFIKAGGAREKWLAVYDAAAGMSGRGQSDAAGNGQCVLAPTRQQVEGGEAVQGVPNEGHPAYASSPSSENKDAKRPMVVVPIRGPNAAQRVAAGVVAKAAALASLDRVKTSDGRPWGDVGAHELDGMSRDGAIAAAIKDELGVLTNAQRFQSLRELMRSDKFETILSRVRGSDVG